MKLWINLADRHWISCVPKYTWLNMAVVVAARFMHSTSVFANTGDAAELGWIGSLPVLSSAHSLRHDIWTGDRDFCPGILGSSFRIQRRIEPKNGYESQPSLPDSTWSPQICARRWQTLSVNSLSAPSPSYTPPFSYSAVSHIRARNVKGVNCLNWNKIIAWKRQFLLKSLQN